MNNNFASFTPSADVMLPLYAQIKETVINAIETGEIQPGDQLPSHRTLSDQYGVSYMTVRRALSDLISEGVLYAIHGKGVYVAAPKEEAELGLLVGFSEDMAQRGLTASSRVLEAEVINASTVMARTLQVAVGTQLVHLARLRCANRLPIAIQNSYLPHHLCANLLTYDLAQRSLFDLLRHTYGLTLTGATGSIGAALAGEEEAKLLDLSLPAALLVTEQVTLLDDGAPIEYVRSVYRADRHQISLS